MNMNHRAAILEKQIADFDFSHILEYHAQKHNLTKDNCELLLIELRRWLSLCASHRDNRYTIFGEVDKLWHTFILFTNDYERFCSLMGGFIHHHPEVRSPDSRSLEDRQEAVSRYESFLADYRQAFGGGPNEEFLPSIGVFKHQDPGGGGGCRSCHGICLGCDICGPAGG